MYNNSLRFRNFAPKFDIYYMEKITFKRDDLKLAGLLFKPELFNENEKYSALIIQGSATSVKEQMGTLYSEKLSANGFVCLTFDYAHYGESDGKPRQYENPDEKLKDLQAAVSFLLSLPYIKDVSMVGICTSGGNTAYLAARDSRIKAIATVAGYFVEPELMKQNMGEYFDMLIAKGDEAQGKYEATGEETIVTAYSESDPTAYAYVNMPGAFDYYLNPERGAVPAYRNEMNVMSYRKVFAEFNPIAQVSKIKCPAIIIASDGCSLPDQAKKFYRLLTGKKKLAWGDGMHFDYYDQPKQVDFAVKQIIEFFSE